MPVLLQWLFCFCSIDLGRMSFHRHLVYPHLCNWWKNQGLIPAPASLVLMWLHGKKGWGIGGDIVVLYICKCGFDVGVYELSHPFLGWCVSGPDPSLVSSLHVADTSECGDGKMGWVARASAPALKVFLAKAEPSGLLSIQPIWWGSWVSLIPRLCLFASQVPRLVMCWLNKVSHAFGSTKLFYEAFGRISLCQHCYLDDSAVNFPLQANGSWRKEEIKKKKKPWWILYLQSKNVFSYENTIYGNLSHSLLWHGRKWLILYC